jgi:hypothetical protein
MIGRWDISLVVKKKAASLSSHEAVSFLQDIFKRIDASGRWNVFV